MRALGVRGGGVGPCIRIHFLERFKSMLDNFFMIYRCEQYCLCVCFIFLSLLVLILPMNLILFIRYL